jgi:two-component system, OmpR family, response regulator ChvI
MPESAGRIAVVDDEASIREALLEVLGSEGYEVTCFRDGAEAWSAFQRALPDLAILDILLPRMDGLELCRRLRGASEELPIVFLTSRDEEFDRVLGLELGADDYLCKPFSTRELVARVKVLFRRAALRRHPSPSPRELCAGALTLDLDRYEARWREQPVPLTVSEFRLLHALLRHPGHVKTRAQLLAEAYPEDTFVSDRTIDSQVKRLRRKFEGVDPGFDLVETVYGLGYRWRERSRT